MTKHEEKKKLTNQPVTVEAANILDATSKRTGISRVRLASEAIIAACESLGDDDVGARIRARIKR